MIDQKLHWHKCYPELYQAKLAFEAGDWPPQAIKDHQDMERINSEYSRALDEEDREDLERATNNQIDAFLASEDFNRILRSSA